MEKINPDLELFKVWTGENLDKFYKLHYSSRTLIPNVSVLDSQTIATYLNSLFAAKWDSTYRFNASAYGVLDKAGSNYEETVTTDDNSTSETVTNKDVTPFDEDEYAPDTKDTATTTNGGTVTKKTNRLNQSMTNINYTKYAQWLMENWLYMTVFNDVNHVCTLAICSCDVEL